jgi:D-xylose transport system substrate-binding protein
MNRMGVTLVMALSLVATATAVAGAAASTPKSKYVGPKTLPVSAFTSNLSVMKTLKALTKAGTGKIAAILPDTVSSTRYVEFDAPLITKALELAGMHKSQFVVQNALGKDETELTDAETDITNGATVLLMDGLDSGVGAEIEGYARVHGVKVIDYDRISLGGSRTYYVSFNNVTVGKLIGQGFVSCVAAWNVAKPQVAVFHGAATDNNATLFADGYLGVIKPYFASGAWTDVANTADTWDPPTALSEFEAAYTANPKINAIVMPNDENAAPIITYLAAHGVKPDTIPITGQDATLTGLQNVLSGYQCGTVYKPIYLEAGAAVALALYLRAGEKPPKGLVNGSVEDTVEHVKVPSILMTPMWVTSKNMNATIIADNFVPASLLCTNVTAPGTTTTYAADCTAAGITP